MKLKRSLPHLQDPTTCPYPEPDSSKAYAPTPLLEDPFQFCHPINAWVFQVAFFPQVSPPKPCIHLFSPPYMLHTLPKSFFLI
jgi:hypothetical protein